MENVTFGMNPQDKHNLDEWKKKSGHSNGDFLRALLQDHKEHAVLRKKTEALMRQVQLLEEDRPQPEDLQRHRSAIRALRQEREELAESVQELQSQRETLEETIRLKETALRWLEEALDPEVLTEHVIELVRTLETTVTPEHVQLTEGEKQRYAAHVMEEKIRQLQAMFRDWDPRHIPYGQVAMARQLLEEARNALQIDPTASLYRQGYGASVVVTTWNDLQKVLEGIQRAK